MGANVSSQGISTCRPWPIRELCHHCVDECSVMLYEISVARIDNEYFLYEGWAEFRVRSGAAHGDWMIFWIVDRRTAEFMLLNRSYYQKPPIPMTASTSEESLMSTNVEPLDGAAIPEGTGSGPVNQEIQSPMPIGDVPNIIIGDGTQLTESQEMRVLEYALSVQSNIPIYVCTINKTAARGGKMGFSTPFSVDYLWSHLTILPRFSPVFLPYQANPVSVSFGISPDGRARLSAGWTEFSRKANLRFRDVCAFHFTQFGDRIAVIVQKL
ncbi:hypothetical protein ACP4OV_007518 [Aristida adscensionis]